jgi:hypothetical protein
LNVRAHDLQHRRGRLRDRGRGAAEDVDDAGAEPDAFGGDGQFGQHAERVATGAFGEVEVADAEPVGDRGNEHQLGSREVAAAERDVDVVD